MADLQYNIESRILQGQMAGARIYAYAVSGGRAGSKAVRENIFSANNSLATHVGGKESKGTHIFGTIPRGQYILKLHESRKNWIRPEPNWDI